MKRRTRITDGSSMAILLLLMLQSELRIIWPTEVNSGFIIRHELSLLGCCKKFSLEWFVWKWMLFQNLQFTKNSFFNVLTGKGGWGYCRPKRAPFAYVPSFRLTTGNNLKNVVGCCCSWLNYGNFLRRRQPPGLNCVVLFNELETSRLMWKKRMRVTNVRKIGIS